jgi:hypothetical protein
MPKDDGESESQSARPETGLDGSGDGRGRNVRRSSPESRLVCRMFSPAAISTRVACRCSVNFRSW